MAVPKEHEIVFLFDPLRHGTLGSKRRFLNDLIAPTFVRSSAAWYVGRDGKLYRAATDVPRIEWFDLDSDGVYEYPALLTEPSRTNLVPWSDDLSQWTSSGTPTVTANAKQAGELQLSLIGDDDTAAIEFKYISVTFTGDGVKSLLCYVAKGSSPATNGAFIKVRDTTASADRLVAKITWSGTAPVVTMNTGTLLGTRKLAGDVYELRMQTVSVTAANAHRVEVLPAGFAGSETGDIYVGGVQVENANEPSSLIRTTGSTVTRSADQINWPFLVPPREMTIYVDFIELAKDPYGNPWRVVQMGNTANASPRLIMYRLTNGSQLSCLHNPALGNTVESVVTHTNAVLKRIEALAVLYADGSVQISKREDGGTVTTGNRSAAATLTSAWSDQLVHIGYVFAAVQALRSIKIAAGISTMDEMAAL
ncbi:MAG: hypothetical protein KatS3mg109_1221 [Pirellulaceae bacterium]|nr:MAG: hypothetical protein KatS3mg109_1221 [Pirellulaceae bacterium]